MSGADDDEEVGREGPYHGTERGHPGAEVEGAQQDVEAQQEDEDVHHHVRQPESVDGFGLGQQVGGVVARRHLVGGHAGEERVGPACALARAFAVLLHFHAGTHAACVVVAGEYESLRDGMEEVDKGDGHEEDYCGRIGEKAFQCVHNHRIVELK